jgi:hypothetical protein
MEHEASVCLHQSAPEASYRDATASCAGLVDKATTSLSFNALIVWGIVLLVNASERNSSLAVTTKRDPSQIAAPIMMVSEGIATLRMVGVARQYVVLIGKALPPRHSSRRCAECFALPELTATEQKARAWIAKRGTRNSLQSTPTRSDLIWKICARAKTSICPACVTDKPSSPVLGVAPPCPRPAE